MAIVDMNPGQLAGTFVLLGLMVVLFPGFSSFVDVIVNNSTGVTAEIAKFILPVLFIAILANFWGPDEEA